MSDYRLKWLANRFMAVEHQEKESIWYQRGASTPILKGRNLESAIDNTLRQAARKQFTGNMLDFAEVLEDISNTTVGTIFGIAPQDSLNKLLVSAGINIYSDGVMLNRVKYPKVDVYHIFLSEELDPSTIMGETGLAVLVDSLSAIELMTYEEVIGALSISLKSTAERRGVAISDLFISV